MALDARILLSGQAPQLDNYGDMYRNGMTMRNLAMQNQQAQQEISEKQTMKDLLRKNVVTDSSGKASLNQQAVLSDLYRVNPEKAMALEKQFRAESLEKQSEITRAAKQLAWSATPETWAQTRQAAIEMGLPNADKLPSEWSDQFAQRWQIATLDGEKQLELKMKEKAAEMDARKYANEQAFKEKEFALKKQDSDYNRGLKNRELAVKEKEASLKAKSGESLPIDSKKQIEALSTKNANKLSIQNQLNAFVESFDRLPDDQKIVQSRQLLKTLNSPEGADAIGSEEAKRLGNLIEFKYFNFTEPGSFMGRDLEEFKSQVQNTARMIGQGVRSNQKQIDKLMGRSTAKNTSNANVKTFKTSEIEWAE